MRATSGPRARAEVGDDGERLERRLREASLDRALEETRAGLGRLAARPKREPAGDLLEHDPAPTLAETLPEESEGGLHALGIVLGRLGELGHRERRGGDDEQRLDGAREVVDGVGRDQAERAVHVVILSSSAREILIGANGAA